MTREELIAHMEHLAEYVKYSEDAPALREVIEMLKTHEEHTETHACDSVNRQSAIDAINSHFGFNIEEEYGSAVQEVINALPPVQPDHIADVSKKVDADLISRREALEALKALEEKPKSLEDDYDFGRRQMLETCIDIIQDLQPSPSAQPEVLACGEGELSAQPERTCVNCGRTANNGGWYADGRTRCPIEEHYALPKDGFCHLWEKRNITDDDYPGRREE